MGCHFPPNRESTHETINVFNLLSLTFKERDFSLNNRNRLLFGGSFTYRLIILHHRNTD